MWSHYGDRHRGICLGFDVSDDRVGAVRYVENRAASRMMDVEVVDESFAQSMILTKYKDWEYEQEVRSFVALPEPDVLTGLYFESFDENLVLREVILGPQCEHSVESARELVGRNSDVEVVKARLAFQTFKVVLDRRSTEGGLADR
jgi:hypothetical protein